MAPRFDPYHKLLGIPPRDQPPNYYRLLGIELFEADVEVIEAAAERQMAYLQGIATGPHMAESQSLLNEVARAKVCLLNPERKSKYDNSLRVQSPNRTVRMAVAGVSCMAVASLAIFAAVVSLLDFDDRIPEPNMVRPAPSDRSFANAVERPSSQPKQRHKVISNSQSAENSQNPKNTSSQQHAGNATSPPVIRVQPRAVSTEGNANHSDVVYLTDLQEMSVEFWEYQPNWGFSKHGIIKAPKGETDSKIILEGKESPNGIFCHPKTNGISSLKYDIADMGFKSFQSNVGIADLRKYGPHTPCTFEVYGDGKLLWKSEPVRIWGKAQECKNLNINGVRELELRVRCPGDASFAMAVWCEPRLLKK